MGEAEEEGQHALSVELGEQRPDSPKSRSQQWTYRPRTGAQKQFASVAWQCGENNYGEISGKNWSELPLSKVTVWARGKPNGHGRFPKLQFKAGGNTNPDRANYPYQASFEAVGNFVTLTGKWAPYSIDLKDQHLSQVISAFVFTIRAQDVDKDDTATFFIDSITYE
jgi:hypothetical protein